MELKLMPSYSSLKRSWRRRAYQKLNDGRRRQMRVIRLQGPSSSSASSSSSRRRWRIKAVPKLCFNMITAASSPWAVWTKLKNSYIRKMNLLGGRVGYLDSQSTFGVKRIPNQPVSAAVYTSEEIENRLVLEIYKVLVSSGRNISSLQIE